MKKILAALAFLLAPVIAQADLINGGFETGNFYGMVNCWRCARSRFIYRDGFHAAPTRWWTISPTV
jgi:hypothetical protein